MDITLLEKALRKEFDDIIWTSVKLDGTRLCIQIKENERETFIVEKTETEGMDIKANKKGKIVSMVTRSGVPCVKVDDEIEPGEILVSGAVPIFGEDTLVKEYFMCKADADIYLECIYQYQEVLPAEYQSKNYTGNIQKIPYIRLGGKEIRFSLEKITSYYF